MPERGDVVASGVIAFGPDRQVLLVHRPRYDDWAFPKGKLDPGERPEVAAVRETAEETGLWVRLGPPLASQRYLNGDRFKTVHYWVAWPVGDPDVSSYLVNEEIDEVVWLPVGEARDRLSYPRDRELLDDAWRLRRRTRALVVLRHGKALPRNLWNDRPDSARPLEQRGRTQADRIAPLLAAYGVKRVLSSPSTRCVDTVRPYAEVAGRKLEEVDGLSEEGASPSSAAAVVAELLAGGPGAVLCTHRPVLPAVLDQLGLPQHALEPGGLVVVHHRKGAVVAAELLEQP